MLAYDRAILALQAEAEAPETTPERRREIANDVYQLELDKRDHYE